MPHRAPIRQTASRKNAKKKVGPRRAPVLGRGRDMFSRERRSEIMSRIRGSNTKPERLVRSLLHRLGYRFRLHRRDLPGRPDIVLPGRRTVVLVHGCWWHLHQGCPAGRLPTGNRAFWQAKLEGNRRRDRSTIAKLRRLGWKVVVLWECEIERDLNNVGRKAVAVIERSQS